MIVNKKEQRIITFLLIFLMIITAFPVLFSILVSFGEATELVKGNYIPNGISFHNYQDVFNKIPLMSYIVNSLIVSLSTTVLQIVISILAAYFFVFIDFKHKNILFIIFMMTMMVPVEVLIVRNFQTIRSMGLLNSYSGLILPNIATTFGIFLLRQNMMQVPYELKEAADISGVSDFYFLRKVVTPMVKNSIFTLGIYSFLSSWNAYLWPLVSTTKSNMWTAQLGLRSLKAADILTNYGMISAASLIVAIPTLIMIFVGQGKLEEGLSKGSIK